MSAKAETTPFEMPAMDVDIYLTPAELVLSLSDPELMSNRAAETGERVWVVSVPESNHFQLITPTLRSEGPPQGQLGARAWDGDS